VLSALLENGLAKKRGLIMSFFCTPLSHSWIRQKTLCVLTIVFLWFILCCQLGSVEAKDEKNILILKALGFVSQENIYKTDEELQNFGTRYSWEKQDEVANYLFRRFREYDIPVEFDEYYYKNKRWKNVIATIHGKRKPGDIYMVIAHFDSISEQPEISAPGADDNASGTAAVLEIARTLKDVPLANSIQFGIFSNEEQDSLGSRHFAKKARKEGLRIIGCINLDVIGYNGAIKSLPREASKRRGLNGMVIIAGRPENESLVKMTSLAFKKYSDIGIREIVKEDCG
jgi:hypothetical protein